MESKYLTMFNRVKNEAPNTYRLNGARILVEIIPKEEIKSAGGLVLAAPRELVQGSVENMRGLLGIVILTGEGYYGDDGKAVPLDVNSGAVVLLNEFATRVFSTFPGISEYSGNSIAITDESAIQMQWPTIEDYLTYRKVLNNGKN